MRTTEWKDNEFGDSRQALYIGALYVGGVMLLHHNKKWRAWFMNDPEGNEVGQFSTADEARECVESALARAIDHA